MVTWEESNGTDFYTATLETAGGKSQTCMSPTSLCGVPSLDCGLSYSVSVTASNLQCNSTQSIGSSLQTGERCLSILEKELFCIKYYSANSRRLEMNETDCFTTSESCLISCFAIAEMW